MGLLHFNGHAYLPSKSKFERQTLSWSVDISKGDKAVTCKIMVKNQKYNKIRNIEIYCIIFWVKLFLLRTLGK